MTYDGFWHWWILCLSLCIDVLHQSTHQLTPVSTASMCRCLSACMSLCVSASLSACLWCYHWVSQIKSNLSRISRSRCYAACYGQTPLSRLHDFAASPTPVEQRLPLIDNTTRHYSALNDLVIMIFKALYLKWTQHDLFFILHPRSRRNGLSSLFIDFVLIILIFVAKYTSSFSPKHATIFNDLILMVAIYILHTMKW